MINDYDTYEQCLLKPGHKVMVFMSDWCPDCHYMETYLSHIKKLYDTVPFYLVDREAVALLSMELNIFGVPSLLVYEGENIIARYVDKERKTFMQVKQFLDEVLQRKDE
ncbi:thioredoxin family protein [Liberiplasma polymorphum]|uniref:thioredoxin family protein n=1 Tax=Liberiplasma polymorphum TaxID=3374570 RepID=UPI003774B998